MPISAYVKPKKRPSDPSLGLIGGTTSWWSRPTRAGARARAPPGPRRRGWWGGGGGWWRGRSWSALWWSSGVYLRMRRRLLVRSAWYASAWTMWISEGFMTMSTLLLLRPDLEAAGRRVPGAHPARGG